MLDGYTSTLAQADWNRRVGHLTYEQAIAELGRPTSSMNLAEGIRTAEWYMRRGCSGSVGSGMEIVEHYIDLD